MPSRRGSRKPTSRSSIEARTFGSAIATTVEPLKAFYAAEAYHQDFLTRNPRHPYIVDQRPAEDRQPETPVPGRYRADAGAGGSGHSVSLIAL